MRAAVIRTGFGVAITAALWSVPTGARQSTVDPFAFLAPTVSVTADERKRIDAGEAVIRTIESTSGELAVFGATRIRADGDRLVAWIRRVDELKRSNRVLAIARFSEPARLEDLRSLSLDPSELADFRACRPGRCELKLTPDEIARVQKVVGTAGSDEALQGAMREIALDRVRRYASGQAGAAFDMTGMLSRSAFLPMVASSLVTTLSRFPQATSASVESFFYWAEEDFGAKPVLSATHVGIARPFSERHPEVVVASRQIFATHYFDGALNITMVTRSYGGGPRYLIFVNRLAVDALGGIFGGITRFVVERRLRGDGEELLEGLRERLESGVP